MTQDIHAVKIEHHSPSYEKAKHTLKTAFPKKEQSPLWALRLFSKHEGVDFLSYYDNEDNYIGVSYSIHDNNSLLLLYLAIDENQRSKGYGTKIIKYLQDKDNISTTVLDIESPYEECSNIEERVNRLHFYEHLGFVSSEQEIIEPLCHYLILGTKKEYTTSFNKQEIVDSYVKLTDELTGGLCKLKIKHIKTGA